MTDFYDLYERQMEHLMEEEGDAAFDRWFLANRNQKGKMRKFWECYVEGTDGGRHYKWYSLELAQNEAERLARLPDVQGKTVYLFEYVGKCKVGLAPIRWEVPR